MITQHELQELFHYEPATGLFTRRCSLRAPNSKAGTIAGGTTSYGYTAIKINRIAHKAHRLAFLYMTGNFPASDVDHINGVRSDNRWVNLRAVTRRENSLNKRRQGRRHSGVCGVRFDQARASWHAQIGILYKKVHLGFFCDFFEAVAARKSAEIHYGFHPNHSR